MRPELLNIIVEFAGQQKIDWRILFAILNKESNAIGFHSGGAFIKKRFEPHIHKGFLKVFKGVALKHPSLPGLSPQWIRDHKEAELEMLSTSYGIAQIMGYWYPVLKYRTIYEMIEAWTASETLQVRDFCQFCVKYNDLRFLEALRKLDFVSIAKQYNGGGYKKNNYDTDLQKYFKSANK